MKYYAVAKGRQTGIFYNWQDCQQSINGFSGAVYKSFDNLEDAQNFIDDQPEEVIVDEKLPYAYIDGSYSSKQNYYSYGGFISYNNDIYILQGKGNNENYTQYRNITGELRGAMEVIFQAINLGIKEINIYHDYLGISQWALGNWKCENDLTRLYKEYYEGRSKKIKINFVHVKGHTGNEGNEIADLLTKDILDAKMTKKEQEKLEAFKIKAKGKLQDERTN